MNLLSLTIASFVVAVLAFGFAFVSVMGESFVEYSVVNNSAQPVYTWYQDEDCSTEIRYREHVPSPRGEVLVPPGETARYWTTTQSTGCIRVADPNRLPLVVQEYKDDTVVTISEKVTPLSQDRIPLQSELPAEPLGITGHLSTVSVASAGVGAIASLVFLVSAVVLVALTSYELWRRVRQRPS
jgi:hypothetical protein